jgi:uncharacterized membrane protein YbaN (DUF454 family)
MDDETPLGASSSYLPVGLRPSFVLGLFFCLLVRQRALAYVLIMDPTPPSFAQQDAAPDSPGSDRRAAARWRRMIWVGFGGLCLALGVIGIVLPVLPTTPFVLLAAFAFGKGSPRLRRWLEDNPRFGPAIRNWERSGAIAPRHKRAAVGTMSVVFALSLILSLPPMVLIIQGVCMGGAACYVMSRPSN